MALCSFSSGLAMDGYTVVDNTFFNEFLPLATGEDVKVYLYGLSLCANPNLEDNSIDSISKVLCLSPEQIMRAFDYWQEMGLVQVVSAEPYEVRFLPIKQHSGASKIRSKDKYSDFNKQIQKTISGRMITPNEYNEYYRLIETYHFEPEAVVEIAHFCTKLKSDSIGYSYILAVARSFANEGIKSLDGVEKKIEEQELSTIEIKQVLSALGIKRTADLEERNLYLKWINSYGFTHGIVLEVAKLQNKRGGFSKLDETLTKYFELRLFTLEEISNFAELQEEMLKIAKKICGNLGLSYQNYDNVIKTYVSVWVNMGFDYDTLELISQYCFRCSVRQLDGMNAVVSKFFKLGIVSKQSLEQYISGIIENDNQIRQVIEAAGLVRGINSSDREFYRTWTENWNFSHEVILAVAEASKGKVSPLPYMNKLLAGFHDSKLSSLAEIKKQLSRVTAGSDKPSEFASQGFKHGYSKEQLDALFDSLDDVEI